MAAARRSLVVLVLASMLGSTSASPIGRPQMLRGDHVDEKGGSKAGVPAYTMIGAFVKEDTTKELQEYANRTQDGAKGGVPAYAMVAPFGKEDTAKVLQEHAVKTQDTLVDAVENAEVAEVKRAVWRALTRLRAAQIKEFDTIARMQTMAIDSYNDAHHYRKENPLGHLSSDEPPVEIDKLTSFH
eukprot:CAMPEP_0183435626 /NCGR_PEP_ID=MMETSP0370-20130417/68725_1 /TAXON_ID=268820 /ORGANISM="Peridinium aciculiferum, Strain PAER-2" /LENGTH=184 /DNA_ID=CAMNT_0025622801 /DNA_START=60 /DNA_END=614 /DNA_ORIENTATION=-